MILNQEEVRAEAMFIADLHLHPHQPEITNRFLDFCKWIPSRTKKLYILGDFIHAWPGDDAIDAWSQQIILALASLSAKGIEVFFMPGNRDFLIGKKFLSKAKVSELAEPTVISLGGKRILLVHGDRYCTEDKAHQRFRRFTRNKLFKLVFLRTPYEYRSKIVNKVRDYSQNGRNKDNKNMQVIPKVLFKHLRRNKSDTVIHGHTHLPGLTTHNDKNGRFLQYVLSDWDENPLIMCYNNTNKFYYSRFAGEA